MCCGRTSKEIFNELRKQKWENGKRIWHGHTQYKGMSFFYDENTVRFCENCGQPLTEEEIRGSREFMGYYGSARASQFILEGYKCSKCGNEEMF
jgi:hypothetical protein